MQLVAHTPSRRLPPPLDARDEALQSRLNALNQSLRFGSPDFEWPAYDWGSSPMDEAAVIEQLTALAKQFQELSRSANAPARDYEP
jgi:hypothetical protein